MGDLHTALLTLQDLDREISQAEAKLKEYDPRMQSLEQPVSELEREIGVQRARLETLRQEARRLERGAEQKRERLRAWEERLGRIRTQREEAAARTEMDLVRRATEADETDALEAMEQATRTDLKLDDMEKQLAKARAEIEPQREALLREQQELKDRIEVLREQRRNQTVRMEPSAVRLYDRVRSGRARVALAPLTPEGACGNCFNILPVQEQAEIRSGDTLKRCEACGVILYVQG